MILHPDLAHAGAPNCSSHIRQMLYFRIKVDHAQGQELIESNSGEKADDKTYQSWESIERQYLSDLFYDFDGIHEIVGREEIERIIRSYSAEF